MLTIKERCPSEVVTRANMEERWKNLQDVKSLFVFFKKNKTLV